MTAKIEIVRQLRENALLLPALLADALAANDRLKMRLTLLQESASHALHPENAVRTLDAERHAAGLDEARYDALVAGARMLDGERIVAPGVGALVAEIGTDLVTMLAPLHAAGDGEFAALDARRAAFASDLAPVADDTLSLADLRAMTSANRDGVDSVHLLVMDAHKAINRLAAATAVETIDGAHVYHVEPDDRPCIAAFMAGLNRTAPLAFGHPGLGTTAARSGQRLTIQNDIGTTDAHVLVIHVEDRTVSVTYTDVHRIRARFFMSLFEGKGVEWSPLAEQSADGLGKDDLFYLVTGLFAAPDGAARDRFLEFLGSRIVFLIDWNKARKALQTFVGENAAIEILGWAAARDLGHRAFLELGGANLVFDVVRRAAAGHIPYGARLDEALGSAESTGFLERVLREASEGLAAGRSVRLIRDEIQADLAHLFDTAETEALIVLVRQLGVARMLAAAIAESLAMPGADGAGLARNAKRLEEKADRLCLEAREICSRVQRADNLRSTVDEVENATDALDECAYMLSLMPAAGAAMNAAAHGELAEIVVDSVSQLVRAVEAASRLAEGQRGDVAEALQAIDAVVTAERHADTAERDAFSGVMTTPSPDARLLILGLEVARGLETATDHLAHAAQSLRERVLEELSA